MSEAELIWILHYSCPDCDDEIVEAFDSEDQALNKQSECMERVENNVILDTSLEEERYWITQTRLYRTK